MSKLLMKDFKLAMHPTIILFWLLSAMLIIPNYPYYVVFFYSSLGIFFVCLSGRENHDIEYALSLPAKKCDIVNSRIMFAVIVELIQTAIAVPFAIIRQNILSTGNEVGMDANIAFFGLALAMMGVFNIVFFTRYYARPQKVGGAFAISSIITFIYIVVAEVLTHIIPFMRDKLDTADPQFLTEKLIVLAAGIVIYGLLTLIAAKTSVKKFDTLDF